jgi:hypothetical protein
MLPEGRFPTSNVKGYSSLLYTVFKKPHSIHEVALCHRNDQINGVEVFLTIKASCQICFMVCGGMKVEAQWASEPEYLLLVAHLKVQ